jgi:hypothetical protein
MESDTWSPLLTAAMILSASAVHVKGFGVCFGEVAIDGVLEIDDGSEDATGDIPVRIRQMHLLRPNGNPRTRFKC